MSTPDQITAAAKAGLDTFYSFASTQFSALEKLSALNLATAKGALDVSVAGTKALLDTRSPQEVWNLSVASAQPAIDRTLAYGRSVYEITSATQAETVALAKAQLAELSKQTNGAIDNLAKSGLPGSDSAAAALKSALSASESAYDSFSKAAKQATDFIEASIAAATKTTA